MCRAKSEVRRGMAATEFAVILPVLVTLVLGCIDFGRFAHAYLAVSNAARAGAGVGAANPWTSATLTRWQSQAQQAVLDEMSQVDHFDSTALTVTVTATTDPQGGTEVQVAVSYPFRTVVNWPGIPNQIQLSQQVGLPAIRP